MTVSPSTSEIAPIPDLAPLRRALISVSDKTGLIPFCRGLADAGVTLLSTGGTARALRDAGLTVTDVSAVTGFPEIMGGRVKTLHPKVHGGLLGVRNDPEHAAAMTAHDIAPIDLVCINLYPFEQTIARPGVTDADAIENIDIGGPSMIRSAAKNHSWVAAVTNPAQYDRVLAELRERNAHTSLALRRALAAEAFALTARYDAAITRYMHAGEVFPDTLTLSYTKVASELRYGENPHQAGALYRDRSSGPSVAAATQLHGKSLSYNNLNDANAAFELALALARVDPARPGACVIKHANPCGAAIADTPIDAVDEAIAGDPLAAYGGILAINAPLDAPAADRLCAKDIFLEVIVAPGYTEDALAALKARWANLRLLATGPLAAALSASSNSPTIAYRSIRGGMLAQEIDTRAATRDELALRAGPAPDDATLRLAAFMEAVTTSLLSNAVALGGISPQRPSAFRLFGAGAGQMDRVTSCKIATAKAGALARGSLAFSDAFFPFSDGPQVLADAGVATIVHPGGSKRDQDTFDLCNARGITCLTTGLRHFRH
ncbi:MAG: bifunctional phosphoribosylaminoimidazolecarboxamide formyltransferase/IMP cyclohydrolase [Planctomycetota bacterium]|nr:bifunctional phosphoribosylaminoimidazolecarboxamide formyltransferase/IMP cyclohydrolase [Planctomycetota bacterium]